MARIDKPSTTSDTSTVWPHTHTQASERCKEEKALKGGDTRTSAVVVDVEHGEEDVQVLVVDEQGAIGAQRVVELAQDVHEHVPVDGLALLVLLLKRLDQLLHLFGRQVALRCQLGRYALTGSHLLRSFRFVGGRVRKRKRKRTRTQRGQCGEVTTTAQANSGSHKRAFASANVPIYLVWFELG
jgi:hypothetical protein